MIAPVDHGTARLRVLLPELRVGSSLSEVEVGRVAGYDGLKDILHSILLCLRGVEDIIVVGYGGVGLRPLVLTGSDQVRSKSC